MAFRCLAVVGEAEAATTVWTFVLRLHPCHGDACSIVSVKLVRWAPGALGAWARSAAVAVGGGLQGRDLVSFGEMCSPGQIRGGWSSG
jgi:hypothetical protein